MKQDFPFDEIGKNMPYTVPEGYFDNLSSRLCRVATDDHSTKRHTTRIAFMRWIGIAAAIAIILTVGLFAYRNYRTEEIKVAQADAYYEQFDNALEQMSDTELQAYSDFVEDHIFIN